MAGELPHAIDGGAMGAEDFVSWSADFPVAGAAAAGAAAACFCAPQAPQAPRVAAIEGAEPPPRPGKSDLLKEGGGGAARVEAFLGSV